MLICKRKKKVEVYCFICWLSVFLDLLFISSDIPVQKFVFIHWLLLAYLLPFMHTGGIHYCPKAYKGIIWPVQWLSHSFFFKFSGKFLINYFKDSAAFLQFCGTGRSNETIAFLEQESNFTENCFKSSPWNRDFIVASPGPNYLFSFFLKLFESSALMHMSAVNSLLSALCQLSHQYLTSSSSGFGLASSQKIGSINFSVERMICILVNNLHSTSNYWIFCLLIKFF